MVAPSRQRRFTTHQQYALAHVVGSPGCTTREVAAVVGRPVMAVLDTLISLQEREVLTRDQVEVDGIWTSRWAPTPEYLRGC